MVKGIALACFAGIAWAVGYGYITQPTIVAIKDGYRVNTSVGVYEYNLVEAEETMTVDKFQFTELNGRVTRVEVLQPLNMSEFQGSLPPEVADLRDLGRLVLVRREPTVQASLCLAKRVHCPANYLSGQ